jgi:hypothetical protein
MDAGFQHFTHRDCHFLLQRLGLESGANRSAVDEFLVDQPRHLSMAGSLLIYPLPWSTDPARNFGVTLEFNPPDDWRVDQRFWKPLVRVSRKSV